MFDNLFLIAGPVLTAGMLLGTIAGVVGWFSTASCPELEARSAHRRARI